MWDFLSKVTIHLIDKVSITAMFFFVLIFCLVWFVFPYEMISYYVAPRVLPVGMYWAFLFVCASGVFLLGRMFDRYCYSRIKRWKAFRTWEKVYGMLSKEELEIIKRLVSQDGAPLELSGDKAMSLVTKNIICVKFYNPMIRTYLLTPSFRAFIFYKYQTEMLNQVG